MADEYAALDATAQAELVHHGHVTPSELVEAAIARIERIDPELNAVIHPLFEKARSAAAGTLPDGGFRGVPFLVKDAVCHTAGDPYHLGMRFLKQRGHIADRDSELARRFRAAGFVFVGKTNTPELAMSVTTEPLAYGATRNPWSLEHSTGGSSGGSAAAVAAGLAPVGHANDMGGSIRIPAAFCGLVGLKPTRARSSLAPGFGEFWGPLTHEHVVTRSVRDCAGVLDAIAGPAPGDPYTAPAPLRPYREEVGAEPGALRIGYQHATAGAQSDPEVARGVEEVAGLLEALGHRVEAVQLEALDHVEIGPWMAAAMARDLDRWGEVYGEKIGESDVEPFNWMLSEMGRAMSAPEYLASAERAQAWSRRMQAFWADGGEAAHDVLLTPTCMRLTPRIGELAPNAPLPELAANMGGITNFTIPFDVTGQPAISLPLHTSEAGLPVGMQLVGPYGREDVLLQLAAQLEAARPWAARRPALHA